MGAMRSLSSGQQSILFFLAPLILASLFLKFPVSPSSPPTEEDFEETVIEVTGDVLRPGIYIFRRPPTLKEAIDRAGGVTGALLPDFLLLSDTLETGTRLAISREFPIFVPDEELRGETPRTVRVRLAPMEANKRFVFLIPIDLNQATAEDLTLIPGIGSSLAREIIAYRRRRGGFRSIEELKNVTGVGENAWKTYKKYLKVSSPQALIQQSPLRTRDASSKEQVKNLQ